MHNLLVDPIFRARNKTGDDAQLSLPGLLAALERDDVSSLPALRPHQLPALHMFLVQLGALAIELAGLTEPPDNPESWANLIRALTADDFPGDEPWTLVVGDRSKPAFLQTPEPPGTKYTGAPLTSPDELDLLITSKNHDLKQSVAIDAAPEDWTFALISLQTCEGFNGSGNYGIGRMNGGSSSRLCLGLCPGSDSSANAGTGYSFGRRFARDLRQLVQRRTAQLNRYGGLGYRASGGIALTWLEPWPEQGQLALPQLDIWFIETCRRVRLSTSAQSIRAQTGTSKKTRILAGAFNGNLGDPWAPIDSTGPKSLTIGEQDLSYRLLHKLLFDARFERPLLMELSADETAQSDWVLVAQALSRGNSKTYGYRDRIIPLPRAIAPLFGGRSQPASLGEMSQQQLAEIKTFKSALGLAIAIHGNDGEQENLSKESYKPAEPYQDRLDQAADAIFFPHLWQRFAASASKPPDTTALDAARLAFCAHLMSASEDLLNEALETLPCKRAFWHRAQTRARRIFMRKLEYSDKPTLPAALFERQPADEEQDLATN